MKVIICSKPEFFRYMNYNGITDENVDSKDTMFISINNSVGLDIIYGVYSCFKRQHSNVLIMHFNDYGENFIKDAIGVTGIFNEYKAKKLYDFIKRNKDKKMAIVHCSAGISRSGAVGTFIFDMYGNENFEEFKRKNPRIQPNYYMLKLLNEQKRKDG